MPANATTAGERRVLAEAPSGELVDLSDLSDDERIVSPDVIRRLCVGPETSGVDPRGIRIKRARIVAPLDLSFCTVLHPLQFRETTFDTTPDLSQAHLPALEIVDCSLPGLQANRIRLDHDLELTTSEVTGDVQLLGARIGGQFDCSGATLTNMGGSALVADQAEINGGVFLRDGFSATGEVRLLGARIGGQLACSGATLMNKGGNALSADGVEINGGVFLRDGFSATGEVRLLGARIGGELDCAGATLTNEGGNALSAPAAAIDGGVFLNEGFSATGEVQLLGARIGGLLACSGATLTNEGGNALSAHGAEINGSVLLSDGFSASGAVWLGGARIGGLLLCSGATLTNGGGNALSAPAAAIDGGVFLSDGFSATGAVRLRGARIGGLLVCSDATLVNEGGDALQARDATITGPLIFRNVRVTGGVDLFRASATALDDDLGQARHPLGSWGGVQPLILDGFTYARFEHDAEWDSKLRRRWLEQTTGFQQGAWQQLIGVYRAQGRDDEATRASIAMHNDRVARAGLPWHRRAGRRVLGAVVGHGYRPWLAGIWAVAIIAAFALIVWQWSGMFVPEQGVTGSPQPIAYAADTFLPIVNLSQADDWTPTGWIRWVVWSVILLGWSLSTIFVAGFTRIVRT